MKTPYIKPLILILSCLFMPSLWTQNAGINEASVSPKSDLITEYLPWVLLATAIALAIVILFMGVLLSRVAILKGSLKTSKNVLALLVLISANSLSASNANQGAPFFTVTVLNYLLIAVILLEVLIILYFANWLKAVILPAKKKSKTKTSAIVSWWNKANKSVAIENEKDVQLDHDYDGIKELDNALPPWWVYGFYLTIVFSAIYVWRYHIGKSAPLQVQELKMAIAAAEIQQAEYDKRNANKVDENTIVYKEDPVLIENGKALFAKNCAACHGQEAGGGTGPNLTDNYWKHGGDIKNVFKTIRYGVPDMGMIAWGDILTPVEIGSLATFIKSIKGSNPINPKEPEGQLEEESTIEEESAEIEKVLSAL